MIPDEAVEAAGRVVSSRFPRLDERAGLSLAKEILEAAAPHMLVHVHHHDIENHARSFNEGYETCMAQELAEDPTTAQDWLDEKLREARAAAWDEGKDAVWSFMSNTDPRRERPANPYRRAAA